jgi:cytoskeleton protein RodZ
MTEAEAGVNSSPVPGTDNDATAVQVGEKLRAARETLRLTVKDLAQRLCLGNRQVEALETGDLTALPGKTFVRGFVRNYAQAVQLDPVPLLALLDQVRDLKSPTLDLPESTHIIISGQGRTAKLNRNALLAGMILVLIACALYFLPDDLFPERARAPSKREIASSSEPLHVPDAAMAEAGAVQADTPETAAPPSPAVPASQVSSSAASPASGDGNALRFAFGMESWVEVRDRDGKLLMARLNAPGEVKEVAGAPPFAVVIGNAAHVTLTYKGQPVVLKPGTGNGVARLTLP